jgi:hypothetical protein
MITLEAQLSKSLILRVRPVCKRANPARRCTATCRRISARPTACSWKGILCRGRRFTNVRRPGRGCVTSLGDLLCEDVERQRHSHAKPQSRKACPPEARNGWLFPRIQKMGPLLSLAAWRLGVRIGSVVFPRRQARLKSRTRAVGGGRREGTTRRFSGDKSRRDSSCK